ncbi:hypothetical protein EJ08DRAFT_603270 [Tothia fuscella]|uniref:RRM domain-containing protein n=1 Tax=Tothia fuscella TaxID=1048955 RepID=A0A9P4P2T3_9PEZI|nr:hypothetical protein EJ08DRAFT_603270 [Tothia fuscella]
MSGKRGNTGVFIGNIPYGVSEEVIVETLGRVGQVQSFRLVYDKETGKPKGFGFGEFADADQAAAAVRNLNDYELMGRKLRVDYSKDGEREEQTAAQPLAPAPPSSRAQHTNGQEMNQPPGSLPPLPPGQDLGQHLTAQDAISATVSTIPPMQLLDAMQQMQNLAKENPEQATELLQQGPQLSYAILQVLVLMKLVDNATLASVLQQTAVAPPPARPPPVAQAPPPIQPPQQQAYPGYPPQQQHNPYGATPPVGQPYQEPPPHVAPPPQQQQQQQQPTMDQSTLIQQVMAMSQAQIDALDPNDRATIMNMRSQFQGRFVR